MGKTVVWEEMGAEVRKFGDGYVNESVWRVGGMVVKRVNSVNSGVVVPDFERFQNELRMLALYGEAGLAPRVLAVCPYGRLIFMTYQDGVNGEEMVCEVRKVGRWLGETGREEVKRFEEEIHFRRGELLAEWHGRSIGIEIGVAQYSRMVEEKTWSDLEMFARSGLLEAAGFERVKVEKLLRERILPGARETIEGYDTLVWTHGDWWTNNNLVGAENGVVRKVWAIDPEFSQKIGGVPEEDLAQEFMWVAKRKGIGAWEAFKGGYGREVDLEVLRPFMVLKILDYLEGGRIEEWKREKGNKEGFWTETLENLRELLIELGDNES